MILLYCFFVSRASVHIFFFFSSRRRHTRSLCDWSSDVCSSDLTLSAPAGPVVVPGEVPVVLGAGGDGLVGGSTFFIEPLSPPLGAGCCCAGAGIAKRTSAKPVPNRTRFMATSPRRDNHCRVNPVTCTQVPGLCEKSGSAGVRSFGWRGASQGERMELSGSAPSSQPCPRKLGQLGTVFRRRAASH